MCGGFLRRIKARRKTGRIKGGKPQKTLLRAIALAA
jgi:hypothetical protein